MLFFSQKGEATLLGVLSLLALAGTYLLVKGLSTPGKEAYEMPEIEELPQKTGFGGHISSISLGLSFRNWRGKLGTQIIGGFTSDGGSVGGRLLYWVHRGKVSRAYFGLDSAYTRVKEEIYQNKDKITDTISLGGLFGYETGTYKKLPILYYLEIGQVYSFGKEKIDSAETNKDEPQVVFGFGAHYYFK